MQIKEQVFYKDNTSEIRWRDLTQEEIEFFEKHDATTRDDNE